MQADWLAQTGSDPVALLHVLDTFAETPVAALAQITVPVLVVAGDQDERQAGKLAAILPHARLAEVPGNHVTALASPELAAAMLAFLSDSAGAAGPPGAPPVAAQLTPELEAAIRLGYEQRDRANMGPTIAYFEALLAEHPDHPVLVYEVAGAYDTAGEEEKAHVLYERAMGLGLDGEPLRRCLCQYGSTLRWLGEYDKSLEALDRARDRWPQSDAVRVFRALTLNETGRGDEAVAELMTVITAHAEVTDLGRYADGLRGLARWLADGRPD